MAFLVGDCNLYPITNVLQKDEKNEFLMVHYSLSTL